MFYSQFESKQTYLSTQNVQFNGINTFTVSAMLPPSPAGGCCSGWQKCGQIIPYSLDPLPQTYS